MYAAVKKSARCLVEEWKSYPELMALAIELRLTIPRPNITSPFSVGSLFIVCVKKLGRQIFFGSDKKLYILGLDSFLQISDAHE